LIISVDTEKALDKTQHPFMIKALMKLGIEGMCFNIVKAIYDKPISQHHTKWRKTETMSSKVRNETWVSTLSTIIQHCLGIPSQSNKTGR
jgi:hypothetical protein